MQKIKDIKKELRPRERLKKYGTKSLGTDELLAIILQTGSKEYNVKELSCNVIKYFDSINDLENTTIDELSKIKGIGEGKATSILASIEFGKRVLTKDNKNIQITNNLMIYDLYKYEFINSYQENFITIYLDSKNNIIKAKTLYVGTLSSASVHPREVFKLACLYSASKIILVHNHPSGDSNPSSADIEITNRLMEIGKLMNIPIIDHIIIGNNNYYSFYDEKKIFINE